LEANGREVYYTENEEYGHTVWVPTYDDPEFWYWLLQQRKS
jgi:predicted peptidase